MLGMGLTAFYVTGKCSATNIHSLYLVHLCFQFIISTEDLKISGYILYFNNQNSGIFFQILFQTELAYNLYIITVLL